MRPLGLYELEKMKSRNRGIAGYICCIGLTPERDKAVIKAANELKLSYAQLEDWCVSKLARWWSGDYGEMGDKDYYTGALEEFENIFGGYDSVDEYLGAQDWAKEKA